MPNSLFDEFDNIIVLDTETTGIRHKTDEIIELAAVKIVESGGRVETADEFDLLIKLSEGKRIPPEIERLTGINDNLLMREGVSKRSAADRFCGMLNCEKPLVVAYNAQFDLCFLYFFLARFGRADVLKNAKFFDALTVYKDRNEYPHKLSDAVERYELKTQNTHRAIDDTKATAELLSAMEREQDDLLRYINIFGYNPKYGVSGPRISSVTYVPQPYDAVGRIYDRAEMFKIEAVK